MQIRLLGKGIPLLRIHDGGSPNHGRECTSGSGGASGVCEWKGCRRRRSGARPERCRLCLLPCRPARQPASQPWTMGLRTGRSGSYAVDYRGDQNMIITSDSRNRCFQLTIPITRDGPFVFSRAPPEVDHPRGVRSAPAAGPRRPRRSEAIGDNSEPARQTARYEAIRACLSPQGRASQVRVR
jgi:hypothetical protein